MKAFWRKTKTLTWNEQVLLDKTLEAHKLATIKAAYQMNGNDFLKAVSSGLGCLGGIHAPIVQAYDLLECERLMQGHHGWINAVPEGDKLPGWGSSFVKGKPDPIVENAMLYVDTGWPEMGKRIEGITDALHARGKIVYPNMACLTAATAIILGLPKTLASVLLLQGRALAWAEIVHDIKGPASQE